MVFRLPGKTDDARAARRLKAKLSLSGTVSYPAVTIQAAQVHPTGSLTATPTGTILLSLIPYRGLSMEPLQSSNLKESNYKLKQSCTYFDSDSINR